MNKRYLLKTLRLSVIVTVLMPLGMAQSTVQPSAKGWGVVNGQSISEDEVKKAAATDIQDIEKRRQRAAIQFQRDEHSAYERALQNVIDSKAIDAEAQKRGMDREALIRSEVEAKVIKPSDQEVRAFYEANKDRIPLQIEEALQEVRRYLTDERRDQKYAVFVESLRREYKAEVYMEPMRSEVSTEGSPSKGPAAAPVTIVEFSDFECPFCEALFPTMKRVLANYTDRVRVVYRQYPLRDLHPHAQAAAEASLCANEQQKFWEMHDSLFQDQKNLGTDALKQKAAALKLDMKSFNSCLDTSKFSALIDRDVEEGSILGISGTPALFINGRILIGARSYEEIASVIDDELLRKSRPK